MAYRFCFLLLVTSVLSSFPFCALGQVVLNLQNEKPHNVSKQTAYFKDETGVLDLAAVLQPAQQKRFQVVPKTMLSAGGQEAFLWVKVELEFSSATSDWVLYLPHTNVKNAEFYHQDSLLKWQKMSAGITVPIHKKMYPHHFQVFPLKSALHKPKTTCYIRLHLTNTTCSLHVATTSGFDKFIARKNLAYGIYMGAMLFIFLNNLSFIKTVHSAELRGS